MNQKYVISVYRGCQEPDLAPVNHQFVDSVLPELPGAWPGSGEPKMVGNNLLELPGARPSSGEPKMLDFGLPELPGARPG